MKLPPPSGPDQLKSINIEVPFGQQNLTVECHLQDPAGCAALSMSLLNDQNRRHLARYQAHGYTRRYPDRVGQSVCSVRCSKAALTTLPIE